MRFAILNIALLKYTVSIFSATSTSCDKSTENKLKTFIIK